MSLLANMGVPMIAVYWPPAWLALIPVIVIEAWWARRILGVPWSSALISTSIANVVSTFIGLPVVWLALAIVQLRFAGTAIGMDNTSQGIYAVTIQSPWLIPYNEHLWWMVPAASIVLTIIFFLASVGIEYIIIRGFYRRRDAKRVRGLAWKGNASSYAVILSIVLLFLYVPRTTLDGLSRRPVDWLVECTMRGARWLMPSTAG